jgi:molybdate transport system ATP-binding protein
MRLYCSLNNVTYTFEYNRVLSSVNLKLQKGRMYAVVGGNGSGKTTLAEIIAGRKRPVDGEVVYFSDAAAGGVGYLSFEEQEHVLARERKLDETWLGNGAVDYGTTGAELIGLGGNSPRGEAGELVRLLRIGHLLNSGCRQFSTGEFRKVLLCRELIKRPSLLLLDEPYDGLDAESREHIGDVFFRVREQGGTVVFFFHRKNEVPPYADKVLCLYNGKLHTVPPPAGKHHRLPPAAGPRPSSGASAVPGPAEAGAPDAAPPVILMRGAGVSYDGKPVLQDINWLAERGDAWMITGPNGSGKSTLLSLVSGDNPKAYGQEIYLFGRKRGSGESVWDIKKKIGFVSGDFQFRYFVRSTVEEVVLSGLFDSIGLYRKATDVQVHAVTDWLESIGLGRKQHEPFQGLSFGQQRMVLVARAMIKQPAMLIADEPCQGLDDVNREDVLLALEAAAAVEETVLLYVTHEKKEHLRVPCSRMELVPHKAGGYTGRIST